MKQNCCLTPAFNEFVLFFFFFFLFLFFAFWCADIRYALILWCVFHWTFNATRRLELLRSFWLDGRSQNHRLPAHWRSMRTIHTSHYVWSSALHRWHLSSHSSDAVVHWKSHNVCLHRYVSKNISTQLNSIWLLTLNDYDEFHSPFSLQFFCFLLIVLVAEVATGVYAYQHKEALPELVKDHFKNSVQHEYNVSEVKTNMINVFQHQVSGWQN